MILAWRRIRIPTPLPHLCRSAFCASSHSNVPPGTQASR
jgi:hypothetical protein